MKIDFESSQCHENAPRLSIAINLPELSIRTLPAIEGLQERAELAAILLDHAAKLLDGTDSYLADGDAELRIRDAFHAFEDTATELHALVTHLEEIKPRAWAA